MARVIAGLLIALYPLLVFLGLSHFDARWLAALLILAALVRLAGNGRDARLLGLWLAAALFAGGTTLLSGSPLGLLLYPVLVNGVLLTVFLWSLRHPPTMVEQLARLRQPDLPSAAVAYTRKVTIAWCVFFAVNGAVAAATIGLGRGWWTLYNGLIAYGLMGALMGGEYLVRKRVQGRRLA